MMNVFLTGIIESFKKLAENPRDAQRLLETDRNFDTNNFTNALWYVGQLGYILRDLQSQLGTSIVNVLHLPPNLAEPLGVCIPAIIIILIAWVIIRNLTKFFKAAVVISTIVVLAYIYLSMRQGGI